MSPRRRSRARGGSHINFRIGQLPEEKVADPGFPAGADEQIGFGAA